ncbi:hypothetical protein [Pseudoalteromonas sp. T1lg76]|uniref:hypothetical protein n=1 Tax=Pseudoalteromonas sp. T1lg76 TaxID=2077103 RepID=UPI000CF6AEB4|nr:hypothetical protein [Pseudoalteromonas sp. T1lg76]
MKNFIIGCFVGILFCSIAFYFVLKQEQENKFKLGQTHGFVHGQSKTIELLSPYLPAVSSAEEVQVLFSVKTTDIVLYKESGKQTIGIRE